MIGKRHVRTIYPEIHLVRTGTHPPPAGLFTLGKPDLPIETIIVKSKRTDAGSSNKLFGGYPIDGLQSDRNNIPVF
jgi:hypothetical protein